MKRLILLSLLLTITLSASAWGPKGHDTVAYIAEQHLSKSAKKKVQEVLGGHSLVYVANWMDDASHSDEYAYTKTWHYVNVDANEESYAASKKEAKGDVVTGINKCVEALKSYDRLTFLGEFSYTSRASSTVSSIQSLGVP